MIWLQIIGVGMSFSIHKKGKGEDVCLRNTLFSTIQGVTFNINSTGEAVLVIHLDSRMKDTAFCIFEKDGFAPINEGIDKILMPYPIAAELERFLTAFEKIEPLDGISKKLLQDEISKIYK